MKPLTNHEIDGAYVAKWLALLAAFGSTGLLSAQEIVPAEVPEHSLVHITSPYSSGLVDVQVLTVRAGAVVFAEVVKVSQAKYITTGPPGNYTIRITCFDPESGVESKVASFKILGLPSPDPDPNPNPNPNPNPDPDPPDPPDVPEVPDDRFSNVGKRVAEVIAKEPENRFRYLKVATCYEEASNSLKEPDNISDASLTYITNWVASSLEAEVNELRPLFDVITPELRKQKNRYDIIDFRYTVAKAIRAVYGGTPSVHTVSIQKSQPAIVRRVVPFLQQHS